MDGHEWWCPVSDSLPCVCNYLKSHTALRSPSLAPGLMAWIDESDLVNFTPTEAWASAKPYFAGTPAEVAFPSDPVQFASILGYAAPLFAEERDLTVDISHVAIDGIISITPAADDGPQTRSDLAGDTGD